MQDRTIYQPFFSTVYADHNVWNKEWQKKLSQTPIFIKHYKDIFNRSHQDFAAQKKRESNRTNHEIAWKNVEYWRSPIVRQPLRRFSLVQLAELCSPLDAHALYIFLVWC